MGRFLGHRGRGLVVLAVALLGAGRWLGGQAESVPPRARAAAGAVSGPTWGVEDGLTRLLPVDAYAGPVGGALALAGARGEVADGQLVLLAGAGAWKGVRLGFSDLRGPGGSVLSGKLVRWRRVGSVRTTQPYYDTRYVGEWPDPLLPAQAFDVAGGGRASAWVDVRVPEGARPGVYRGTVGVSSAGGGKLRVPLTLRVWGFTLPRVNHLRTSFGFQPQTAFPLDVDALYDDLLAHRLSPDNAVGDPNVGAPGGWDWGRYDRAVARRLAQGMTGFRVWLPPPAPSSAGLWQAHLASKGWLGLAYTYQADEPVAAALAGLSGQLGQIKQAAPGLRNLVTARGYPDALTGVDVWCPDMVYFDADISRREQARGRESWWYPAYPTRHPMVNVWTDYPALDCRVWAWMTWKYGLDGMLYWDVCCWQNTPDPLQAAPVFRGDAGAANGDGQLVYPGPGGRPIDSVRLEALRDGVQDYEVFCLLEAGARELRAAHKAPALAAQAQALLAVDPGVLTSYTKYNPDPQALLAARGRMSRVMEGIVSALGREPVIVGRPRLHPEVADLQARAMSVGASKP